MTRLLDLGTISASARFNCPHCSTQRVSSRVAWGACIPQDVTYAMQARPVGFVGVICGECWRPLHLRVTHPSRVASIEHHGFEQDFRKALNTDHSLEMSGFETSIVEVTTKQSAPEHLSMAMERAFLSAERNFTMTGGEDAAATMYRRSIDVAIREAYPNVQGMLNARINKLAEDGVIPAGMKDWADHIRWIGNDGAHEPEGVTQEELRDIRAFSDAFLRYLITMPEKVRIARSRSAAPGGS